MGLGVGIRVWRPTEDRVESVGSYGWGSVIHSGFHVDPVEDMWMVALCQRPDGFVGPNPRFLIRAVAYEAIID